MFSKNKLPRIDLQYTESAVTLQETSTIVIYHVYFFISGKQNKVEKVFGFDGVSVDQSFKLSNFWTTFEKLKAPRTNCQLFLSSN